MSTFYLRIATPDRDVFSGETEYLSLNTPDGREGFMRGSLPRVLVMSSGKLEITIGDEKRVLYGADGIVCVKPDGVTVLTSHCEDVKIAEKPSDRPIDAAQSADGRQYDYAKARLVSSIRKSRDGVQSDD